MPMRLGKRVLPGRATHVSNVAKHFLHHKFLICERNGRSADLKESGNRGRGLAGPGCQLN
jgi:hypothetical protein